ncbi:MAG: cation:proton antiporter [Anaerolineae bacterium]|nr:cation:proton antiporter [Anaerolineae bacterium]
MTLTDVALLIVLPLLIGSIVLTFIRLVRGPKLPDRVVALDFLSMIGISITAVYAIASGQPLFLDVALVLALISFLGTVALAFYIERRNARNV